MNRLHDRGFWLLALNVALGLTLPVWYVSQFVLYPLLDHFGIWRPPAIVPRYGGFN